MAIEDWISYDYDDDFDPEPVAYGCSCKWCREPITMTPQDDGSWKPMSRGKIHFCEARRKSQVAEDIASMPDMSLPDCQFCNATMIYRDVMPNPDDGPGFGIVKRHLACPNCGACGPLEARP